MSDASTTSPTQPPTSSATPGPLVLLGDRPFTTGAGHDAELLERADTTDVVLLPTAAAYEDPDRWLAVAGTWFGELGAKIVPARVLSRGDAQRQDAIDLVANARLLYLVGESPMHLRSVLWHAGVGEALVTAWRKGAVVAAAGGSAMALSDPMVDPRGGAFTIGLGLVSGMAIVAQSEWSADQARRTIRLAPSGVAVVGIDAQAALWREPAGTWRATGGDVVVYRDGLEATLADLPADVGQPSLLVRG